MREGTDRDKVETERCNLLRTFERHVARTFHEHLVATFLDNLQGFGHHFVAHVVEHDDIDTLVEECTELVEVFDFHFNHQALLVVLLDNFKSFKHATGGRNVVVLHEHHVKETHAVVGTTTDANGVFLQSAETRNRLASIEHLGLTALQCFLERVSHGCHTGELLDEVQERAFARQKFVRCSVEFGNQVAFLHDVTIFLVERHLGICLEFLKHEFDNRKAGEHAIFFGDEAGMLFLVSRNSPFTSHIARANVLGKREADHGQSIFGWEYWSRIIAVHYCAPFPVKTT